MVYLPPYSPDLSPIELYWSKFKQFLKKAKARRKESLHEAISNAINTITKENVKGWFGIAGMLSNKSGNAILLILTIPPVRGACTSTSATATTTIRPIPIMFGLFVADSRLLDHLVI